MNNLIATLILVLLVTRVLSVQVVRERELGRFKDQKSAVGGSRILESIVSALVTAITGQRVIRRIGAGLSPALSEQLRIAGLDSAYGYTTYLAVRASAFAIFPFFVILSFYCSNGLYAIGWSMLALGILAWMPQLWLEWRTRSRASMVRAALPSIVTLLDVAINAGFRSSNVLERTLQSFLPNRTGHPLLMELARAQRLTEAGETYQVAFRIVAEQFRIDADALIFEQLGGVLDARTERIVKISEVREQYFKKRAMMLESWYSTAPAKTLTISLIILFCCLTLLFSGALATLT